jgi:hypothetical protein
LATSPQNKKRTRKVQFCGSCCVTYPMRRKRCDCGNENLSTTTQPAALECNHCGGDAIVSPSGLFTEDDGGPCLECGHPGHVSVDEDVATWIVDDENGNRCQRADCVECPPGVRHAG